ncbi:hypothetical protein ACMD2_15280 [Ananas comosus]|uniref:Uncharacterized protein n=1 Tax=Ananas comosus TaxID=4615 RepID=A0A199UK05_ANACO|nr:hypothetical protein ACMD2_15280 [Ananas comosus]
MLASCYERKRTRGKTIGLKWAKKRKEEKAKPAIEIPEDLRRVVDTNFQQFITETAQIIRQNAPLNVEKWSKMPPHIIDRMVKVVNEKFTLPKDLHVLGVIRISEANKANRSKQTIVARVGTKSIARNLIEMRKEVEKNMEENNEAPEEPEYMRSGYVRGMGPGLEPLERGGVRGQRLREQIREDIEAEMTVRIQAEVEARMAEKEAEVQARIAQREADAEVRLAQREARLEHMESQMQAMMRHLAQMGMPIPTQSTST